jgi:transcription termination/antitermination protein NusG
MEYFVIQIKTGIEQQFLDITARYHSLYRLRFIWLRKNTGQKKKGITKDVLVSLFPGYIFVEAERIPVEDLSVLRTISGFIRFLRDNQHIDPLSPMDREIVRHFISFGEIVGKSKAYFDENSRIKIVSGPLEGLEGSIIKVDRRKKRAKVKLDLYEDSLYINLDFELIDRDTKEPISE